MTAGQGDTRRSRVLVALDSGAESAAAIEAACAIAERQQAELVGIFAEDASLERAMGLGVARLVTTGAALRDVDPQSWRRSIRALVSLRRRELSRSAESHRLPWSFRTEEGKLSEVLLRAAVAPDVVIVGHLGPRRTVNAGAVVALVTDAGRAGPVLELARAATRGAPGPVHVVLAGDAALRDGVAGALPPGISVHGPAERSPAVVARALRDLSARLVVATTMGEGYLDALRSGLACPLALLS